MLALAQIVDHSASKCFSVEGLYVAQAQGYYSAAGLTVNFLDPSEDAYKATPASRVASGQATFAVAPSETVVSYNCQPATSTKPQLQVLDSLLGLRSLNTGENLLQTLVRSISCMQSKLEVAIYLSLLLEYICKDVR